MLPHLKSEKQSKEQEDIFTKHISDKELISEIYKKSPIVHQQKKPQTTIIQQVKDLNIYLSKENIQEAKNV